MSIKVTKKEFELLTRGLSASSMEEFSDGTTIEHYGFGRGQLVGYILSYSSKKTYYVTSLSGKEIP